jgi:cell division initiation protein
MKVTPEEIRNYTFNKSFRGYEKEAVDQYLYALSQEWQKENDELVSTKKALEIAERELNRLKEVESIMLRTIKEGDENAQKLLENAQKKADDLIAEATKTGDEYYAKKKAEGDEYWAKAENKGDEIVEAAENEKVRLLTEANETIARLKEEANRDLEVSEKEYNSLDIAKQQLLYDLNALLGNTNDRLTNIQTKYAPEIFNAKKVALENISNATIEIKPKVVSQKTKKEVVNEKKVSSKKPLVKSNSPKIATESKPKTTAKPKMQVEIEPEDDGLPTVQKILAMVEQPQLPTVEIAPDSKNVAGSFFDTI